MEKEREEVEERKEGDGGEEKKMEEIRREGYKYSS